MKTTMSKVLMTASFLTIMSAAMPAMANPSVLCSVRANYEAAGTGAAYQPGVDVNGNAVAPADTAAPVSVVPQTLRIPLTVDLAQRLNEVLPDTAKLETEVGVVEVRQDGHVIINGKDLTGPATAMCNNIEKQKEAALKTKDAPKVKKAAPKPVEPEVMEPEVTEPVAVETPVVEEPQVEAAPEATAEPTVADPVVTEPVPAAPVEPAPQVLEPTPPPPPMPEESAAPAPVPELVPAEPEVAVPPPAEVVPPVPDDGAILSPTEGGIPRPPMDPLAATPTEPPPPAPMTNDASGGMLSGGAQ